MDITSLFPQLHAPTLYEQSTIPFWEDEHISKGMLDAHLNPQWDAASRNSGFMNASAEWIAKIIPPDAYPSLIDLGCGPGLYAERFARLGYKVTGMDISPRSIAYAKESAKNNGLDINYYTENYLRMSLPSCFDFATLIYCDYGALSTQDRAELLKRTYDHLRIGGRLLLDVSTTYAFAQFEESQSWNLWEKGGYWSERPYLALEKKCRFQENVTLHQAHIITSEGMKTHYIWHTYFSLNSIRAEVENAGFKLVDYWCDVAGTPYNEASHTLALLLER